MRVSFTGVKSRFKNIPAAKKGKTRRKINACKASFWISTVLSYVCYKYGIKVLFCLEAALQKEGFSPTVTLCLKSFTDIFFSPANIYDHISSDLEQRGFFFQMVSV